jgi:hypothetical protein
MSSRFIPVRLLHYVIRVENVSPLAAKPLEFTGKLAVLRGLLGLRNFMLSQLLECGYGLFQLKSL